MAHCTLTEGLRRRAAIFFEQILFQTARIDPDADRQTALAAFLYHRGNPIVAADVARIDSDLIRTRLRCGNGRAIVQNGYPLPAGWKLPP